MATELKRRVTAGDIATTLGLAPATVSHVLGGRGDQLRIKAETQERIWSVAREMGYRANVSARAMRTGRSGNVALVQPELHPYLPFPLLTGLSRALERRNMHLTVAYAVSAALADVEYLPKVVREWAADGLIVNYIAAFPSPFLDAIREHNIPSIWVNSRREADSVYPDDFWGGQMAARHLLDLGHTDTVFLHADPLSHATVHYSTVDRYGGYAQEIQAAGHTPRNFQIPSATMTYNMATVEAPPAPFLIPFLRRSDRPTAIVCYELENAIPLLLAAAYCGLRVPEDLSVIAFHGWEDGSAGVAVTTIENRWGEVAEAAVESLERKISSPNQPIPSRAIAPIFRPGATTAPPQ